MKKKVKVFLAFVLSVLIVLSLAACEADDYDRYNDKTDATEETTISSEENAVETVRRFFDALMERNKAVADNCLRYDFENVQNGLDTSKDDPATEAMKEHFLDTFKYEIIDAHEQEDETVIVNIVLNTVDMTAVLPEYIKYAIEISSSAEFDESFTQEKLNEALESYMTSLLTSNDTSRIKNEFAVEVVRDNDFWLINADEKFFDAITGDMITAGKELNESDY